MVSLGGIMTKTEFMEKMAEKLGGKKEAQAAYNAFMDTLSAEMKKPEGEMSFPGFGKFKVVQRGARKGRNPSTGAEIEIPAKKTIVFHVSKTIQSELNPDK